MATPAAVLSVLVKAEGVGTTSAQLATLDKNASRTNRTFSALGSAAKTAGAAIGVAGLALGVKTSVDEFREAQKVGAQTNAVLKSTGGVANVTAKEIGNLSTAISKKSGIDDEAIQKGANLLLTFKNVRNEAGRGRDIFNQATRAAVDLSVAGFGSLDSTSKQLGKALNDPVKGLTALGRAGVTFSAQQKSAITALVETGKASDRVKAQQMILREVMSQVGGSAAAQATNTDKLRVSIGNVAESIGGLLVPALDLAAGVLVQVIGFFQRSRTATTLLIAALTALTAAWVASKVAMVAFKVQMLATAAATTIATGGLNLIIPAIAALSAALLIAYARSKTFRDIVNGVASALRTALFGAIDKVLGAFSSFLGAVSKVAGAIGKDGLARNAKAGQNAIDDLRNSLNNVPARKDVEVAVKIKLDGQDVDVSKAKPLSPTPPGGDGPGVIGSRIADAVRASRNVHNEAKKLVADGIGALIPGIGSGKVGSLMGANSSLAPFAALGARFGLHVSSGKRAAGGRTVSGGISYHGSGQAIDLANGAGPDAAKLAAFRALKSRYGSQLAELIYTPGGVGIKDGRPFRYTGAVAADHFDHVHVAFTGARTGGRNQAFTGDGPGSLSGVNLAIDAARKAGFKGTALVNMIAIAGRESGYNPRVQNLKYPDHSIGLWQINQLAHKGRFGSDAELMNAYTNARAAYALSGGGRTLTPWQHRGGPLGGTNVAAARRAVLAFSGSTSTGGAGNSASGSTSTSGAASGAVSTVEKVNPFDQKIASADLAIQQAQTGKASTRTFQKVAAMVAKRKLIGKRITSIRKALKGKLSPGKRLALTQELTQRLQEHAQLGTDIQGLVHPAATVGGGDGGSIGDVGGGDGSDPNQPLIDAQNAAAEAAQNLADAMREHQQAIDQLQAEIKAQNQIASSTIGIGLREAQRALADMISGQIGGYPGAAGRALTAGAGTVVRY